MTGGGTSGSSSSNNNNNNNNNPLTGTDMVNNMLPGDRGDQPAGDSTGTDNTSTVTQAGNVSASSVVVQGGVASSVLLAAIVTVSLFLSDS